MNGRGDTSGQEEVKQMPPQSQDRTAQANRIYLLSNEANYNTKWISVKPGMFECVDQPVDEADEGHFLPTV